MIRTPTLALLALMIALPGCSSSSQPDAVTAAARDAAIARLPRQATENIDARADWFFSQRAFPLDKIPAGAMERARRQASRVPIANRGPISRATSNSVWEQIGPVGFTARFAPEWGTMSGRVRALAIDPNNADRLFLATATGGVWRSTDGGASFTPLTDTEASLGIGAIAISSADSNRIYAGTGEGNGQLWGSGLLRSADGGATWTNLAAATFSQNRITDLSICPGCVSMGQDTVVVCSEQGQDFYTGGRIGGNRGIYFSDDDGANFGNRAGPDCSCRGLITDPSNSATLYASLSNCATTSENGIWKSVDTAGNWAQLTAGSIPNGAGVGRLDMGISANGLSIYLGGILNNTTIQLHRSTDAGTGWSQLTPTGPAAKYCEWEQFAGIQQCEYDNVVSVNPASAADVFYGGIGLYRSTDSGANFVTVATTMTNPRGPMHVDQHVLEFAGGNTIYSGNDGGLYKSTDNGATWTGLGGSLATVQAYHVSIHPTNRDIVFQGTQDNGTIRRISSNFWSQREGGDGSFSAIDPVNPQNVYMTFTGLGGIAKSIDGGETSFGAATGLPSGGTEARFFVTPLVIDPQNPSTLYAGLSSIWRTTNAAGSWQQRSALLGTGTITQIALAPSNSDIMYLTTNQGAVHRSIDGAANFSNVTQATLPGRHASGVAIHPTDPDTAYVTYSGFNAATPTITGHVFFTSDAGATWTDVSGNLPDVPTNAVAIRPDVPQEIYVATDVGVFISTTGGTTWAKMNGLPNVPVLALAVDQSTNVLVAATYGRSTWRTPLNPACAYAFDLGLTHETITATQTRRACNTITAGTQYQVGDGGDLTFIAGQSIRLTNGFSVRNVFRARIGAL